MIELRQSTARVVSVGSAVAVGDGVTPVTNLTLGGADQTELLKANGAAPVDISGYTFAAVTGSDGWYDLSLTASGADTLGALTVVIQDEDLILPIEKVFMVVTQQYWDSKYGADKLQVDVVEDSVGFALNATVAKESTLSAVGLAVLAVPADVWLNATRTLTSFGTLVADVWAYVSRTLTSGAAPTAEEIDTELTANHGAGSWLEAGGGGTSNPLTITIEDQFASPVIGANVTFTDDATGEVFLGSGVTDASGEIVFAGQTPGDYGIVAALAGYDILQDTLVVVVGASAQTVVMNVRVVSPPAVSDLSTLYGYMKELDFTPIPDETVSIRASDCYSPVFIDENGVCLGEVIATTDVNGKFERDILKGVRVIIVSLCLGFNKEAILTEDTHNIADL